MTPTRPTFVALAFAWTLMSAAAAAPAADSAPAAPAPAPATQPVAAPKPIKALLITGGPYHDYTAQKTLLTEGIDKRANVAWTIYHMGDKGGTAFKLPIYESPDWAKGYDVIVHNECFADVQDEAFIKRVTAAHAAGVPGVFIHCCMHTFRAVKGFDDYRHLLGVTTVRHEKARSFEVKPAAPDHPVMKGFPAAFKTPVPDEVYVIDKVWPDCTVLATAYGEETKKDQPCAWVNRYGKAKVFGTTLGHPTEVIGSDPFLDTVARGLLWTCDKLGDDGKPAAGYGPAAAKEPAGTAAKP
ncbi:MAG: Trehalose utilization [Phycisphaerales bacterium]|nr:Trehalose utilization [Phycisphaerales bacterium]